MKEKKFKDPLKIDFKKTTKDLIKGAFVIGVTLPLTLGLTKLIGGNNG